MTNAAETGALFLLAGNGSYDNCGCEAIVRRTTAPAAGHGSVGFDRDAEPRPHALAGV